MKNNKIITINNKKTERLGAKIPYLPYLSEELIYLNEIDKEMNKDSKLGKICRWYKNELTLIH